MGVLGRSILIGGAAYLLISRVPGVGGLLGWCALGGAGWWYAGRAPRYARLAGAAGAGAGAAVVGTLAGGVLRLLLSVLHPLSLPLAVLALIFDVLRVALIAILPGAVCGLIGGLIAERSRRR